MIFAPQLLTGTRKCIVAMEGNGPLHGTARDLRRIVMSDDPVAGPTSPARGSWDSIPPYLSPGAGRPVSRQWRCAAHRPARREIAADRASVFGFARVRSIDCGASVMISPQFIPAGLLPGVCRIRKAADSLGGYLLDRLPSFSKKRYDQEVAADATAAVRKRYAVTRYLSRLGRPARFPQLAHHRGSAVSLPLTSRRRQPQGGNPCPRKLSYSYEGSRQTH